MSTHYKSVHWNRQKRTYDTTIAYSVFLCMCVYMVASVIMNPMLTVETLILRGTSLTAFVLLHVILCIGPLARLRPRYIPWLYNRRHLGVTMFLLAIVHGVFAMIQFHALGDENPIVSIFTAYRRDYWPVDGVPHWVAQFPFEPFGFFALVILFLMAATSHDFWLRNLGAVYWKLMHMGVYCAYGMILVHVAYGVLQSERSPLYVALIATGFIAVVGLHLAAWRKEGKTDAGTEGEVHPDGYVFACEVNALKEGRGKIVKVSGVRLAVFLYQGRVHAVSNVCRHQGGPIGEGRILDDGCITCPWHGWQYKPDTGTSPPPFAEVIPTYNVRVEHGRVLVHPLPNALGSVCMGAPAIEYENAALLPEPFFVGYRQTAPSYLARFDKGRYLVLTACLSAIVFTISMAQSQADHGKFEFGVVKPFHGVISEQPVPMIHLSAPMGKAVSAILVNAGKWGAPEYVRGSHGHMVQFNGTLIYRDGLVMVEMNDPESFKKLDAATISAGIPSVEVLGNTTITGELVDTKCFLGVMRPATGKVHRACAVRCLSGGIPPGVLVRGADGETFVCVLAGDDGAALDIDPQWAALDVRAEGRLEMHDGLPILRVKTLRLVAESP
ncbi:MAG: hypothetical protein AMXMBFR84_39360 [Candidatus Hydrogenedentota bacterium]